jgi:hypothetical protein
MQGQRGLFSGSEGVDLGPEGVDSGHQDTSPDVVAPAM